jgi:hypothetical protein
MKDTFYFPHDYEPTSDPKMIAMLGDYGATGYGLYWRIVEMLHSSETHTLLKEDYIYVALSKQMSTPVEQVRVFVEDCVNIYKLFDGDDDQFLSNRVMKNIEKRKSISEMRSKAGKISAQKREEKSDF